MDYGFTNVAGSGDSRPFALTGGSAGFATSEQGPPNGLGPDSVSTCDEDDLRHLPTPGAAESGAVDAPNATLDPILGLVIERWPALSEAVKADIIALAQQASG